MPYLSSISNTNKLVKLGNWRLNSIKNINKNTDRSGEGRLFYGRSFANVIVYTFCSTELTHRRRHRMYKSNSKVKRTILRSPKTILKVNNSFQTLWNCWMAKKLIKHKFFVRRSVFKTEFLRIYTVYGLKFSEIINIAMLFQCLEILP